MKNYTDLPQSKKLAEILPLESADMCYLHTHSSDKHHYMTSLISYSECNKLPYIDEDCIPCWSLAALLEVLPYPTLYQQGDGAWGLDVWVEQVKPYSVKNAICEVDACYEMILKLNELKLL